MLFEPVSSQSPTASKGKKLKIKAMQRLKKPVRVQLIKKEEGETGDSGPKPY